MLCGGCGTGFKMNQEDVEQGWRHRLRWVSAVKPEGLGATVNGIFIKLQSLYCDSCGELIGPGEVAACISMWRGDGEMSDWEHEYGKVLTDEERKTLEALRT